MKRIHALPLIALLASAPFALAQQDNAEPSPATPEYEYTPPLADEHAPGGSVEEGSDLIGRGMDMLLQNLLNEMAPEIDGLSQDIGTALEFLGPAVSDLSVLIDDIQNYETPERLENGDIVIRRKADAPPAPEIGEGLRNLDRRPYGDKGAPAPSGPPVDPYRPQIEL